MSVSTKVVSKAINNVDSVNGIQFKDKDTGNVYMLTSRKHVETMTNGKSRRRSVVMGYVYPTGGKRERFSMRQDNFYRLNLSLIRNTTR